MATQYEQSKKRILAAYKELDGIIAKLGNVIREERRKLNGEEWENLKADICRERGPEIFEAAVMVAEGKLDVRLTVCQIKPKTLHKLAESKETQAELVFGKKFKLDLPDGSVVEKDFFLMNAAEKHQLLGDEGRIRKSKNQEVKVKPRGQITVDCKDVTFDELKGELVLNGKGNIHAGSKVAFMVERLSKRGKLDAFIEALQEARQEIEEEAEPVAAGGVPHGL